MANGYLPADTRPAWVLRALADADDEAQQIEVRRQLAEAATAEQRRRDRNERSSRYQREKRAANKAAGLCACGRKRDRGGLMCSRCLKRVSRCWRKARGVPPGHRNSCGYCGVKGHNAVSCPERMKREAVARFANIP